jgi:hypothetical protein
LKDHTFEINDAHDLVIRYIRIRYGDENKVPGTKDYKNPDALRTENTNNVIFDHVSASWGVDGVYDEGGAGNLTVQWSIFAEPLNHSFHPEGVDHGLLSSYRDIKGNVSIHHSLFASAKNRQPTLCGGSDTNPDIILDFRNNVSYDWKGATNLGTCRQNVVNNYYRPGPDTSEWKQNPDEDKKPLQAKTDNEQSLAEVKAYIHGNLFEGNEHYSDDNYDAIEYVNFKEDSGSTNREQLEIHEEIAQGEAKPQTDTAEEAYRKVLDKAGASLHRDAADERLIQGIRDKTSKIIDSPKQVGGWPVLASEPPAKDTDGDGMPDDWEKAHGLDIDRAEDRNHDFNGDGYTNLEKYLNERAGDIRY